MNQTTIEKVLPNKLVVIRTFDAPLGQVWKAWTEKELLEKWWAPKPWKAKSKEMDFTEGGNWLYAMVGPDGTEHWCRADYEKIEPLRSFSLQDTFCDENGKPNNIAPSMHWNIVFNEEGSKTKVKAEIQFASEADLEKIVEMGFKEGFTAAHGNLDELLQKEVTA
ncbi:MAG: SRPBCC domain-containing protein [Chitinophagaceae bacterium]